MKTLYDILEVNQNASQQVIKTSYRTLVKKYHPDNNVFDRVNSEEKIKEL